MPNDHEDERERKESVGASAKKFYLTSRGLIESILRDYDLGPTQYYVLHQLVADGPTLQRDVGQALNIERATMSGIIATLVSKGLVSQQTDVTDQRQRRIGLTAAGRRVWEEIPDPIALTEAIAFDGVDPSELALASSVLQNARKRLVDHLKRVSDPGSAARAD